MVQPAANEGEVQQRPPLIRGRFFFFGGNEAEAGSGPVVVFHPSLRDGVGSNCKKRAGLQAPPPLRPSLFVLAPIMAALGDIRTTLL